MQSEEKKAKKLKKSKRPPEVTVEEDDIQNQDKQDNNSIPHEEPGDKDDGMSSESLETRPSRKHSRSTHQMELSKHSSSSQNDSEASEQENHHQRSKPGQKMPNGREEKGETRTKGKRTRQKVPPVSTMSATHSPSSNHFALSSHPVGSSSGFSSTTSDTSVHSSSFSTTQTSGTSSPLASGSYRLANSDILYRDEKPKVLRSYVLGKLLGEGSYGKVKEGIDSKSKKMVAIKILSRKTLRKVIGGEASVEREINIISSLDHDHVVRILNHFMIESKQKFYIVFEYMKCGTLSALLESAPDKKLPIYQARKLFAGLIEGLEYLRERRILHRDIKPDNLLVDSKGELKISDFGVAEIIPDVSNNATDNSSGSPSHEKPSGSETAGIGSPAFQAPEFITIPKPQTSKKSKSTPKQSSPDLIFKSDIWSAGIVLYIMIVGEYPFSNQGNIMALFDDISSGRYTIPDDVDPQCADLIKCLLSTNPEVRIDIPEIKVHPWMTCTIPKAQVPLVSIPSMWSSHEKSSLSSVVKKMKPLMKKQQEEENASRVSLSDEPRMSGEDESSNRTPKTPSSSSKCSIM